ncbi:hypothetical protein CEXT_454521 [Caerostris extrusa]|uniref:Uncharacterized protein n=1 Tax=Caerostris extrusa TaxID=172846 RepID=A0AAV4M5P9_CAEEX|nr:hypothetical protein CEXT_454521 [Caerostris extrusa]
MHREDCAKDVDHEHMAFTAISERDVSTGLRFGDISRVCSVLGILAASVVLETGVVALAVVVVHCLARSVSLTSIENDSFVQVLSSASSQRTDGHSFKSYSGVCWNILDKFVAEGASALL